MTDTQANTGEAHGFRYRPEVLEALALFGIHPTPETPASLVREFLNDLYRWELRRLRDGLLARRFPKREFADRVVDVRRRYVLLSVPVEAWVVHRPDAAVMVSGGRGNF